MCLNRTISMTILKCGPAQWWVSSTYSKQLIPEKQILLKNPVTGFLGLINCRKRRKTAVWERKENILHVFVEVTLTCETHATEVTASTCYLLSGLLISFCCLFLVKYGIKIRKQVRITSTLFLLFFSNKSVVICHMWYCTVNCDMLVASCPGEIPRLANVALPPMVFI
jgi:hypothetical protein